MADTIEYIVTRQNKESEGQWNLWGIKFNGRLFIAPACSTFFVVVVVSCGTIIKIPMWVSLILFAWIPVVVTLYILMLVNKKPKGFDADWFHHRFGRQNLEISLSTQRRNPLLHQEK